MTWDIPIVAHSQTRGFNKKESNPIQTSQSKKQSVKKPISLNQSKKESKPISQKTCFTPCILQPTLKDEPLSLLSTLNPPSKRAIRLRLTLNAASRSTEFGGERVSHPKTHPPPCKNCLTSQKVKPSRFPFPKGPRRGFAYSTRVLSPKSPGGLMKEPDRTWCAARAFRPKGTTQFLLGHRIIVP